jgi:tetratricopeptide (TPR) repeat protein
VLSGDSIAKLLLAWEISTSPFEDLRDGRRAQQLLEIEPENYFDKVRILETKAAVYAELGDFDQAINFQKKAFSLAEKNGWEIPLISERLELYQHNNPYRGGYYGIECEISMCA